MYTKKFQLLVLKYFQQSFCFLEFLYIQGLYTAQIIVQQPAGALSVSPAWSLARTRGLRTVGPENRINIYIYILLNIYTLFQGLK